MKLVIRIKAISPFDETEMAAWMNAPESVRLAGLRAMEQEFKQILIDEGAEIVEVKAEVTGDDETND